MNFDKITESDSKYDKLESKSVEQLLNIINTEDQTVSLCVKKEISKKQFIFLSAKITGLKAAKIVMLLSLLALPVVGQIVGVYLISKLMLAAIGIGILAKQFHVMLGLTSIPGGTIEQLMRIPDSFLLFLGLHPFAGVLGAGSLLFLFLYSRIRNPYFHLIPAPMWVVVGSIGIGYYYALVLNKEVF